MRRLFCCCLTLTLAGGATRLVAEPAFSDPDLVAGMRHVDEGDFEAALPPLDRAVRTLSGDAARSRELAHAHLYLGIAYVYLDQEKAARASVREALKLHRDLRLGPGRFPPKVVRVFDTALESRASESRESMAHTPTRAEPKPTSAAEPAPTSVDAAELAFWTSLAASKNAKDFEEYLRQYPQGRFVGLAGNRIEELRATQAADFSRLSQIHVSGRVANPGAYPYEAGITVGQALTLAGGVTERGSSARVKIVRLVGGKKQEVKVKPNDPVAPNDTIVVPERFF